MDYRATLKNYYVLSKPGIVYSNVLTAIAGYVFGAQLHLSAHIFAGLVAGLGLLIAGACASNNYLDRNIDTAMQRTKKRGLVTGDIKGWQAIFFATATTLLGLAILIATQNRLTALLTAVAWIAYVIVYGIGKRTTVHGTLLGCISGSLPLIAGYTAASDKLDPTAGLLFLLMTAWQMGHFYGIALYRLADYQKAKVPIMPVVYGAATTKLQAMGYIALFTASCLLLVLYGNVSAISGGLLAILGMIWFMKGARSYVRLSPEKWGKQTFLFSLVIILAISGLLIVDPLLPV